MSESESLPFVPEVRDFLDEAIHDARRTHGGESDAEAGQRKVEDELFEKLRNARVRFADDVRLLYDYMRDPHAPVRGKMVAVGALLYFILPIDLIPDVIPVVGFLDDAAVIATAVSYVRSEMAAYRARKNPVKPRETKPRTGARTARP